MGMTINTNIPNLTSQRAISKAQAQLAENLEKISSGLRVNHARDDAAGLAIGTDLDSQIKALEQAIRNTNDGVSAIQTADGAMNQSTDILQRMRELAVQGANDLSGPQARGAIQQEMDALKSELDRIGSSTEFNGRPLLDGSFQASLQVGGDSGETIEIGVSDMRPASIEVASADVSSHTNASAAIEAIDKALGKVGEARSGLGAMANRLNSTLSNSMNVSENLAASRSRIMDADFAKVTTETIRQQMLSQSGVAALSHSKASSQAALSLL